MISTIQEKILAHHISSKIKVLQSQFVSGGCINTTMKVTTNQGVFFVKLNGKKEQDLFEKEVLGLKFLTSQSSLYIPGILGSGTSEDNVYLILEWIEKGPPNPGFWEVFGQKLAQQHQVSSPQFGLDHDNHIGRLPQSNKAHRLWSEFFIHERLVPQLELAKQSRHIESKLIQQFERLYSKLDELVPKEPTALLHGDLWSGNFMCASNGEPYVFDPAIHFGHRETELAFTTLFGGFDQYFYESYREYFPLEPGFDDRIDLHNLYPLLVHVNLFGPSYLSGIKQTLKRFI